MRALPPPRRSPLFLSQGRAGARSAVSIVGALALALTLTTAPASATTGDLLSQGDSLGMTASARATATAKSRTVAAAPTAAPATYGGDLRIQKATLTDRRQSGPSPQQSLSRIEVTRDLEKRTLTARVTFESAPTSSRDSVVYVLLGSWNGSTCQHRVAVAAAATSGEADGAFYSANGSVSGPLPTTAARSGSVLTITSKAHDGVRSGAWDCAFGFNQSTDATPVVYSSFFPKDLVNTYVPRVAVRSDDAMVGNYKGKAVKVRVQIENVGKGSSKSIAVKASGKGLSIAKAKRTVSTLKKGSSQYLTFSVTLKGSASRTLTVTATPSGGKSAKATVTVAQKPRPSRYKSLSGRYFWGFVPTTLSDDQGRETRSVWFLDKRWAYIGVPKDGKKPRCTKTTSSCKRYTYNAKKGVAKIGAQKFTVTSEGFRFTARKKDARKAHFEPVTLLAKGAKIAVTLERDDWTGYCTITCTATSERISFAKNGRFVWQRSSVGNWSGIGSSWAVVPPDQRGTYRIVGTGRVELRYSNGKKKYYLIGAMRDVRGKTSLRAGIVVGGKNFY